MEHTSYTEKQTSSTRPAPPTTCTPSRPPPCPQNLKIKTSNSQHGLAHRQKPDSAHRDEAGQPTNDTSRLIKIVGRSLPRPMTATLLFVVPDRSGGRALTTPGPPTCYQQTVESPYHTSRTAQDDKHPKGVGRRGDGPVAGAAISARTQGAGRPRE
jgi:hypothetical protein